MAAASGAHLTWQPGSREAGSAQLGGRESGGEVLAEMGKVCWPGDPGRPPPPNQGPSPAPSSTAGSEAHLLAWAPAPKARQATRAAPFCFPLFISPFHLPSTIQPPPPNPSPSLLHFWKLLGVPALLQHSRHSVAIRRFVLEVCHALPCPISSSNKEAADDPSIGAEPHFLPRRQCPLCV